MGFLFACFWVFKTFLLATSWKKIFAPIFTQYSVPLKTFSYDMIAALQQIILTASLSQIFDLCYIFLVKKGTSSKTSTEVSLFNVTFFMVSPLFIKILEL